MSASVILKVGVSVAASSLTILPVLLVTGLAVFLQEDLSFGESQLGTAVAAYFASGALASAPAGRLAERLGPRRTTRLGLACGAVSLAGIGLAAGSWTTMVAFLILGGVGHALAVLGVNVLLAREVPSNRQGLAFGMTQAAIPLAALLAGLSVPAIGLTLGWRWAFVFGAAIVPLTAVLMPVADAQRPPEGSPTEVNAPIGALVLLATGMALASAGGTSCAGFIVASTVDRGFAPAGAGLVLAAGSLVGLAIRITAGWFGDGRGRESLVLVAGLVGIGGLGYVGLAVSLHPAPIVLSALLAFGGGWGWSGLVLLAVTRAHSVAPGNAMGIALIGSNAGAVAGPLAFGWIAEHVGFSASWFMIAAMAIVGAGTMLLSHQRIRRARNNTWGHE